MDGVLSLHGLAAGQECYWTSGEGGVLTLEVGPCRLMVATIGGMSRFLVYRQGPENLGCPLSLLASGTRLDASMAKVAAEAVAIRIASVDGLRPKARR